MFSLFEDYSPQKPDFSPKLIDEVTCKKDKEKPKQPTTTIRKLVRSDSVVGIPVPKGTNEQTLKHIRKLQKNIRWENTTPNNLNKRASCSFQATIAACFLEEINQKLNLLKEGEMNLLVKKQSEEFQRLLKGKNTIETVLPAFQEFIILLESGNVEKETLENVKNLYFNLEKQKNL